MGSNPGAQLHSRYNPQAEAERFINSLELTNNIECFILIEPGLGYLIPVLGEKFKTSKIIALHIGDFPSVSGASEFQKKNDKALVEFLEKEVPDIDSKKIRIIEWRPSMNYYGKDYVKLLSLTVEFLKRADAGRRTTAAFGIRWVRNFFKNLKLVNSVLLYRQAQFPFLITGSGPGLEAALPVIEKLKDKAVIIAASSSILALSHHNIHANIVIATDGGSWAPRHLCPLYRNVLNSDTFLAVNLCAALPSQCANTPFLLINDGSFWQNIVLNELGLPSVIISQKGTVIASAVELAMKITDGNIFLAGVDLCADDIRTHVRPYAFDDILAQRAFRFTPVYSQSFTRSSLLKEGGSMDIYASWFRNQLSSWPKRIFSLGGSNVFESSLPKEEAAITNSREFFKTENVKEDPAYFCKRGAAALLRAFDDNRYAENLRRELSPLLFPGENSVNNNELKAAITQIADRYAYE